MKERYRAYDLEKPKDPDIWWKGASSYNLHGTWLATGILPLTIVVVVGSMSRQSPFSQTGKIPVLLPIKLDVILFAK